MTTVLLCDDNAAVRFALEEALEAPGVTTLAVASAEEAIRHLAAVDAVVTDLAMPGLDGFGLLAACQQVDTELPVILLTAHGNERTAVRAIRAGAYDYLAKPFAVDDLRLCVGRALEARRLRRAAAGALLDRVLGTPVVGESAAFQRLVAQARRVGRRDVTVLVRGETGTGKELIATLLHASSPRAAAPCVRFNAAALPDQLAEAELFGHEKGAFTGAVARRAGYFREAHRGTLIIDEIGELSLPVQAKLLRALQDGEIQPVGASRVERVDVRVIACTHRDLQADVRSGRFREDLYYRIAVVELAVPPLRERAGDVPLLIEVFRAKYARSFELDNVHFADDLLGALAERAWPGNVRELENAVVRLLALAEPGQVLTAQSLQQLPPADEPRALVESTSGAGPGLRAQVLAFERSVLQRTLEATGQNQSEAARRLGISRMTLIEKLKRSGLKD